MDTRVLIIDDDEFCRESIAGQLEFYGYRVSKAREGIEGLELLERDPVDLVLTDLRLPGMDGLQVLAEVRSRFPTVAVVLITGYSSMDSAVQAIRWGAVDYLLKPCDGSRLHEQIEAALSRHRRERPATSLPTNLEAVTALIRAVGARDKLTLRHSEQVARYAALLSESFGLPVEQVQLLWLAGLLHDIGKIGMRDSILNKPGPLSPDEYRRAQEHARLAAQILNPISSLRQIASIVLHHHERYDGTGYPGRLAGKSIPWGARLLAVVDAFEAMTSRRSYRPPFTIEQTLQVLQQGAGSQWDQAMVDAWIELVHKGRVSVPPAALGRAVLTRGEKYRVRLAQHSKKRLARRDIGRA